MDHLSPALTLFVLHNSSLHSFPSYLRLLAPSPVLISPHPLLSASRVFILFCGELCYDKAFTPRMYAVSACVMPLWGMGALTCSASPTRPALPRQRGLGGGAGHGWRGWLPSTPCPVLPDVDGNLTHTQPHEHIGSLGSCTKIIIYFLSLLFS